MRQVQASQAKTHFAELLDDVERGETLVITRHGKAIARLVPELESDAADLKDAMAMMQAVRNRSGRVTVAEILSARDEGRKG